VSEEKAMADFRVFELDALEREQAGGPVYREFMRRPGASVALYLLSTQDTDKQHPHFTDEIYVVLGGKGGLRIEDTDHEVRAGSVVMIGHGVEHHYHDITEDLRVLVIMAPPEPGTGSTVQP
jgi:mannose-6-phosphate isomerase-like protein (cupin superfamily)